MKIHKKDKSEKCQKVLKSRKEILAAAAAAAEFIGIESFVYCKLVSSAGF